MSAQISVKELLIVLTCFICFGCSSHFSTLQDPASSTEKLYILSKGKALKVAHHALSEAFPGQSITTIKGPPDGYVTTYRMLLDTYSQQVLAIPVIGTDLSGQEVRGYYFEVSGSGTAVVSGHIKNSELFVRVKEIAARTGREVALSSWKLDRGSTGNSGGDMVDQLEGPIENLAAQLSGGIKENQIKLIAILPMYDASHEVNRPLGNYLTEKLTNALYNTGSAKLVERAQLVKVIKELHLTMSGRFDESSVKRIGKLLGVDAIIVGSYTELGNHSVEVNSRIVNAETAEILGVGTVQFSADAVAPLLR